MLPDVVDVVRAMGIDFDQLGVKSEPTWDQRRTVAKARNVHARRAAQVALRCISLGRWVAQASPSHPAWSELTACIDEFYAVFYHGQSEVGPRMTVLVEVATYASEALTWRYVRAAARAVVGTATPADRALLKSASGNDELRHAAGKKLGTTPMLNLARLFIEGRSASEDFPEREWAETLLFTLRKLGVGQVPPSREKETLATALALLKEWPSKGGASFGYPRGEKASEGEMEPRRNTDSAGRAREGSPGGPAPAVAKLAETTRKTYGTLPRQPVAPGAYRSAVAAADSLLG